eukprot:CAMPEP_0170491584 /NCGR_PEP_ID=MMETSP0208-20121228/11135_1 /TAXON_ID=197538 /ORGANISM="Strombidium inclinatum, Strain S3" /LENGTH=87 /DNA_ID=CAMNT_0010767181 /DNA_START=220 /DNA_END=483 /DNA_ORIENTATION=+
MYTHEGFRGLFRGNAINCFIQAPFTALEFYFYDFFKYLLFPDSETSKDTSFYQKMVCGGLTGITATVMLYPADLIKTFVIMTQNQAH